MPAIMRLHWLCNEPTPYNDFLFRSIAADPSLDLTVYFAAPRVALHPWAGDFRKGYRSRLYHGRLGIDWQLLQLSAQDIQDAFFVVAGWDNPTNIALMTMLTLRKKRFAFWSDTPDVDKPRSLPRKISRYLISQIVLRGASAVLATGDPGMSAFRRMGCPSAKLENLPFFVEMPPLPQKLTSNGVFTFAAVGIVQAKKGFDILIEAYARLLAARPEANTRLLIVGDGPDRSGLEAHIAARGLGKFIMITGWCEPDEVSCILQEANVVIHPARRDPFPVVVLEAMALAKPVLGSDASGSVVDRVVDGVNGLVHRAGDVEQLAAHMLTLLDNPSLAISMGRRARETAEEWPVSRGVELIRRLAHATPP